MLSDEEVNQIDSEINNEAQAVEPQPEGESNE